MVTELIRAIATGSVPDLVTIDSPIVASFSAQGTLTDLTDKVAQSKFIKPAVYFKGPWASGQWRGKTYAVPRDANTLGLYYNADLFRAKGLDPDKPPGTWSELKAAAQKLRDPAKNVYGFGFCATQAEEGVFQWLPFLWQAGGSIDKLDQPEAAAALQYVADMVQQDIASKDVHQPAPVRGHQHLHGRQYRDHPRRPMGAAAHVEDREIRMAAGAVAGEGRQADQGRLPRRL